MAKSRFDLNSCMQTETGNRTYCSFWSIVQSGSSDSSEGNCKCTKGSVPHNNYCANFFCDQTVTTTTTCGSDDDAYTCYSRFNKYKTCRCLKEEPFGRFCTKWQCLGYNDGPVKIANWFCKSLATQEIPGYPPNNDFCYSFGSDQYSSEVQEAKDCICTQEAGVYCATWICEGRIFRNWPWWTPIVGSLVGGLLNLWTPFVARYNDSDSCAVAGLLVWTVLSYLEIVLVGGVPSLLANTGALILMWLFVYRDSISMCYCYCSRSPPRYDFKNAPVTGTVVAD
jgi:hypothetical protein